jgi:uncharacterized membrane protein SpoIIM required for sporulation
VWQNARVLLGAALLAFFTFGVMALIVNPIVYLVLGYLLSQLIIGGQDLAIFAAALAPHGIVEIPMILLATAAAFHLGSVVTRPPRGTTVGHAWVVALGDTLKVTVGLILPGLVLAAIIEAYVTLPLVASVMAR